MRVPVPELEGHAAGASLGCPVRWLEAVSVRDPPPCPTTAPAVSTGGALPPPTGCSCVVGPADTPGGAASGYLLGPWREPRAVLKLR